MSDHIRRREFLGVLGGAAAWPVASSAQAMPAIGFLHSGSADQNERRLAGFRKGLAELGFTEGRNVAIEYRWADGDPARLPGLAADLIQRNVQVITTPGSTPASVVAKRSTSRIPIVFAVGSDAVSLGLVKSLSHPEANVTGVTSLNADLAAKRLGLLRELVPIANSYFVMINQTSQLSDPTVRDMQRGAAAAGVKVDVLRASTDAEIEAAFASLPQQPGVVVLFGPDSFFFTRRSAIAALAMRRSIPTIFDDREYAIAGGLASYGADWSDVMRLAGQYVGRILKGEKAADLPVQQADKFELVINTKTAKALRVDVPPKLLFTADEVIE
jgi:putative ABC transport system substrate-binding protein